MITFPKSYFTPEQRAALLCTAEEGVFWAFGAFWLTPSSPFNPQPGRFVRLLDCYEEWSAIPPPPPETVGLVVNILREIVPPEEREQFEIEGVILRATAAEYYAK